MRVGAFESLICFTWIFVCLHSTSENFLHHLKVGGNPFREDIKWHFFEISELKNHQKNQKVFFAQIFIRLFSLVFTSCLVTLRRRNTFFVEYVTAQTHNCFKSYQGSKIISKLPTSNFTKKFPFFSFDINCRNFGIKQLFYFLDIIWNSCGFVPWHTS